MEILEALDKIDEMRKSHLEAIANSTSWDSKAIFEHLDEIKKLDGRKVEMMKAHYLYTMDHPVTIQEEPKIEEPEVELTPMQKIALDAGLKWLEQINSK